ncbi:BTAD domain-containing putative transcriptional regulator [Micromonospora krabiensis]|uniref:Predicted ATPase n=1 Tax=Micromonospora krabiensis TaxID=307121 RepID=A0A1C3N2Y1_9ACTN|nr:BTAD domain-containing putative transcriptional regulator [Micromonospora krabiensis]SBV26921.1 Predicted ATPase [Micromonospora krabiensis]
MRFGILGTTQVYPADGRRLAVGGPRLRALLALLLLDAGRIVPRDRLVDGLYGDDPPAGVANALQSQVSRLRQVLSAAGVDPVEFHPAGYRLAVEPADVDVHRFGRLADAGRAALAAGDPHRAADLLREALALWRGEPLADVTDAPFAAGQAARLRDRRLAATEDRIEAELTLAAEPGAVATAPLVAELRELVAAHPLRERLHGQLMRALHADGRRTEALTVFAELRRLLAEELGSDPSAKLVALHTGLLRDPGAPRAAAAPRPAAPPSQLTSFVGRDQELRRLGKQLGEARLVTLHGPGGAGKTRLAVEAAERHGGPVCLVELAAVPTGGAVAPAVLAALGLRDGGLRVPGGPPDGTERLVAALADRRILLVLDNCEHVVTDAARLAARLLGAAPALRILATSREPLGVTGEALCPVQGLPVPPDAVPPEVARDYPAVRLFADRAADVAPGFAVDAGTIEAVLRICRTLDGLPLAIELAAARLRALPVGEVAARLDDRFRLLSRGSRVAEPRHQTLRAVVRWSWDLLDEPERRLARRLSVFAGNPDLVAVEGVCGLGADALDAVTGLAEKSLVEAVDGRFRMLETVRAFAAEQLAEAGETDPLRAAHAAYFLDLARAGDVGLRGAAQLDWLRRLDAERDDLHAALRRAVAGDDVGTALRLVAALSFYWWLRGLRGEGAALAGQLVDRLGGPPPDLAEEYALCLLVAGVNGAGGTGPRDVTPASDILWGLGRPAAYPFLLYLSGMAAGPPSPERISLLHDPGTREVMLGAEPWSQALGSLGMGMVGLLDGRYDEASAELAASLDGFRAIGERWGMILALATIVEGAYRVEDPRAAVEPMAEALRLAQELGSAIDMAELLRTRADGRIGVGDLAGAAADYRRVVEVAQPAGAPELVAAAHSGLGEIARQQGDLDRARLLCEQAIAECPAGWFGAEVVRLSALVTLGRIAETVGDAAVARAHYRQVLGATLGVWDVPTAGAAVEGLVGPVLRRGDGERAALLLGAAAALLRGTGAGDATEVAPVAAATRATIGDTAFDRAFAQGAGLDREQAAELLDVG